MEKEKQCEMFLNIVLQHHGMMSVLELILVVRDVLSWDTTCVRQRRRRRETLNRTLTTEVKSLDEMKKLVQDRETW